MRNIAKILTIAVGLTACGGPEPEPGATVRAIDANFETAEDTPLAAKLEVDNPENVTLEVAVTSQPAHGTLEIDGTRFAYRPDADFNGADGFAYELRWNGGSATGEATINVLAVNDAPAISSVALTGAPFIAGATITAVPAGWSDVENDAPKYRFAWTVNGVPIENGDSTLSAAYVIKGNTIIATVTPYDAGDAGKPVESAMIIVENTAPLAFALAATMNEDAVLSGDVAAANDPDAADTLVYQQVSADAVGAFSFAADGSYAFSPAANWNGDFHFTYLVTDGTAWSAAADGVITVVPANDAPAITAVNLDRAAYVHGQSMTATPVGATDVDGDPVSYLYRWMVDGVTVPAAAATLPATYVTKGKQIRVAVTPFDGNDAGADVYGALMTVQNTAPAAADMNISLDEDIPTAIDLAGSDVDTIDTLTYEIVAGPTQGAVSSAGATVTYTPDEDVYGADSFSYRVSDGTAWSPVATVSLAIAPVNDAPSALAVNNANQVVEPGASVNLQATAEDVEADPVTFTWMLDGVTVATGSSYAATAPTATGTQQDITLRAGDGSAFTDLPVWLRTKGTAVDSLSAAPTAVTDTWTFTATPTSYTGVAVSDVWWRIGGSYSENGGTSLSWRGPGVSGMYQIELRVTDAAGYTGFFTTAAAITTPTQWAGFGNDRQNTSQHLWSENLGGPIIAAPISTTGAVAAIFNVGGQAHLPLSLGVSGTLLGSRWTDQFFAIRITDGSTRWTYSTYTFGAKPSVSSGGTVYFGEQNSRIDAFRELDGLAHWSQYFGGGIARDLPLGSDGRIFASNDNNKLLKAVNPADGSVLWSAALDYNQSSNAVVAADGTSYVGAGTKLYAVYATGTTAWALTFPQALRATALGSDGTIYTGGLDDTLYAVAPTGAVKWSRNVGQDVNPPKIGADGTLYVKTTNGNLAAVSAAGELKWTYPCLGTSVPAIGADGTIYLPTYEALVALIPSGAVKWSYTLTGYYFGSPVIDADGYVYAGASDGNIYKFK